MINGPGNMQYAVAARQTQQGGDWFFWVAGLSVVNAALLLIRAPFGFFFSLGVAGYAARMGGGLPLYLAVTVVASGVIALCGLLARRGARWAFLVGMILYVLDALLCLSLKEYLEIAAHAYALFRIFQGFQGAQQMSLLRAQQAAMPPSGYQPPTPGVWPPPPSA